MLNIRSRNRFHGPTLAVSNTGETGVLIPCPGGDRPGSQLGTVRHWSPDSRTGPGLVAKYADGSEGSSRYVSGICMLLPGLFCLRRCIVAENTACRSRPGPGRYKNESCRRTAEIGSTRGHRNLSSLGSNSRAFRLPHSTILQDAVFPCSHITNSRRHVLLLM